VTQLPEQVDRACAAIRRIWRRRPRAVIVLGTGMGRLSDQIEPDVVIDYEDIPCFPTSSALGHRGRLICGTLADAPVVVMDGRSHVYEGFPHSTVALPVTAMRALGAELLVVSNASGGLNFRYATGDIVVIEDHINFMWGSPLTTHEHPELLTRLPQAGQLYDASLIDQALAIARRENFAAYRGVYVAMSGPNYETRAEYRFLRQIGGDLVGMSTVPEVLVAAQCGLRVLALSTVTNVARPDAPQRTEALEVLHDAEQAAPNVGKIVRGILSSTQNP